MRGCVRGGGEGGGWEWKGEGGGWEWVEGASVYVREWRVVSREWGAVERSRKEVARGGP